jgi:hypothetical protein
LTADPLADTDEDEIRALVDRFCQQRRVPQLRRPQVVPTLKAAFDILAFKGPDERWRSVLGRSCPDDLPLQSTVDPAARAERAAFDHTMKNYGRKNFLRFHREKEAWFLSPTVLCAANWARFSESIRLARERGLGWMIPASRDLLLVPTPTLRYTDAGVLHNDNGLQAISWPDGTGTYFLDGLPFRETFYRSIIDGTLSLSAICALSNVDHRSIALRYMKFDHLISRGNAELLDVGVRGTRLYRPPLPPQLAADRAGGYGSYDYFIHMRDASHPEREFVEWVSPVIGAQRNAELCQAHAFGIPLDIWLSVEMEG